MWYRYVNKLIETSICTFKSIIPQYYTKNKRCRYVDIINNGNIRVVEPWEPQSETL